MTLPAETIPQEEETLITGEEFFAMGDIGPAELVRGRIVRMSPPGHPHGFVEANVAYLLQDLVRRQQVAGRILVGETGVYTTRDPDTVRGMDVAFISHERLQEAQPEGYLDVAPELIVEILSPNDLWREVMDKLAEYFAIGAVLVWMVDPRKQQVYVYRSRTDVAILSAEDEIDGGDVLPGFSVPVPAFFVE